MTAVGADGWPIVLDEAPAAGKIWGYSIPRGVRPSAVPVHLVYGPPASGKTTYVRERSAPADTVIDLDEILERVGGRRWSMERGPLNRAFAYRDRMIHGLADKAGGNAWLIITAPTREERAAWTQALGSVQLHPVIAPPAECIRRIRSDADRAHAAPALVAAVRRWFDRASPARAA